MIPPLHLFSHLESTNLTARHHFHDAVHGEGWLTDAQSAGRGRREQGGEQRTWFSPPQKNIYLSVVIKSRLKPEIAPFLTLSAGACVVKMLEQLAPGLQVGRDQLWLKWPNDIYVNQKKLAGILTEGMFGGGGFSGAIVGIGLNVNITNGIPEELEQTLTSLSIETGLQYDRLSLALALQQTIVHAADRLEEEGVASVMELVKMYDHSHGRQVIMSLFGEEKEGIARGISDGGGLLVELNSNGVSELVEVKSGVAKLVL